ncbi:uncharacterized protein LOC143459719 [Clavelina lepadiformis]|uniref:uncharacterized protein LOC143459719 n=1 Tax=Clavelina lepadiformis TaxID=159417 RepID=UPI00404365D1
MLQKMTLGPVCRNPEPFHKPNNDPAVYDNLQCDRSTVRLPTRSKKNNHNLQGMKLSGEPRMKGYLKNEDIFAQEQGLKSILKSNGFRRSSRLLKSSEVRSVNGGIFPHAVPLFLDQALTETDLKKGHLNETLRQTFSKSFSMEAYVNEPQSLHIEPPSKCVTFNTGREKNQRKKYEGSDKTGSKMERKVDARYEVILSSNRQSSQKQRETKVTGILMQGVRKTDKEVFTEDKKHHKLAVKTNKEKLPKCLQPHLYEKIKNLNRKANQSAAPLRLCADGDFTGGSGIRSSGKKRRCEKAWLPKASQLGPLENELNKKEPQTGKIYIQANKFDGQNNDLNIFTQPLMKRSFPDKSIYFIICEHISFNIVQ